MRYSLLQFIGCPYCREEPVCLVMEENVIAATAGTAASLETGPGLYAAAAPSQTGDPAKVPAVHRYIRTRGIRTIPTIQGSEPNDIATGLLICGGCGHWYPITGGIPEILPDHLRDWQKDLDFLSALDGKLPGEVLAELKEKGKLFAQQGETAKDNGSHYKKAEISIQTKVTDVHFFEPGYTSPFNRENPGYTIDLLKRMSFILPLLELKPGERVLDTGSGYSWTTEWLMKLGYEAIGVDITRSYLDIGRERMGNNRPHLILADIENLPLKDSLFRAILCYDSFHHIPDRARAMGHFSRVLKPGGKVVLAEPGGEHEHHPYSREVMQKYGILEKGMEIEDLRAYSKGLEFDNPEQHYFFKIQERKAGKGLFSSQANIRPYVDANVYTLEKRGPGRTQERKSLISRLKSLLKLSIFKVFIRRQRKAISC